MALKFIKNIIDTQKVQYKKYNTKGTIQKEQTYNHSNASTWIFFLSILDFTLGQPLMLGHQKISQFQWVDDKVYRRII